MTTQKSNDSHPLVDAYGRKYKKLRISILDACNFRCNYCMPDVAETPASLDFMHTRDLITPEEIFTITQNLVSFGVEEVRLTGGEPTLRKDLTEIAEKLSELPLKKLALTTNAFYLEKFLQPLRQTRLSTINISIDSVDPKNFKKITGKDGLPIVLKNIRQAKQMGFEIKLNCVMMRGINDHELFEFVELAQKEKVPVRFLELMRIGVMSQQQEKTIPTQELLTRLKERYDLQRLVDDFDSTSMNFELQENSSSAPIKIGFIASETIPFCHGCSRLRLTADGKLKACLFKATGINIRNVPLEGYPEILEMLKKMKPTSRITSTPENMYKIGG